MKVSFKVPPWWFGDRLEMVVELEEVKTGGIRGRLTDAMSVAA